MKYIKQFAIIMIVTFLGEVLRYVIPLPVPASIYGLILMFSALCTGVIKVSDVKETGKFFLEIMPILFIPSMVGLMVSWKVLAPILLPVAVIMVVSTVAVMAVSGRVTQAVMEHGRKVKG